MSEQPRVVPSSHTPPLFATPHPRLTLALARATVASVDIDPAALALSSFSSTVSAPPIAAGPAVRHDPLAVDALFPSASGAANVAGALML